MGALFYNFSVIEHYNVIEMDERENAVRNNDSCFVLQQSIEIMLYFLLILFWDGFTSKNMKTTEKKCDFTKF